MFLVDTNVINEARKGERANAGVRAFFAEASEQDWPLFLSMISNRPGGRARSAAPLRPLHRLRSGESCCTSGVRLQGYGKPSPPRPGRAGAGAGAGAGAQAIGAGVGGTGGRLREPLKNPLE